MDDISIHLIEDRTPLCEDIVRYINSFAVGEELNDNNFKEAIKLWFKERNICLFKFGHISNWDTSNVTNMRGSFQWKTDFNEDISKWDVSNVTNMFGMFCFAFQFNSDLSDWNVSKVKSMRYMFHRARCFNCDISGWDVGSVDNMDCMFHKADSFNKEFVKDWNYNDEWMKRFMFG